MLNIHSEYGACLHCRQKNPEKYHQSIIQIYLLPTYQIPEQQFVSHLCCLLYVKF